VNFAHLSIALDLPYLAHNQVIG